MMPLLKGVGSGTFTSGGLDLIYLGYSDAMISRQLYLDR